MLLKTFERVKGKAARYASKQKCSLLNVRKVVPANDSDALSALITVSVQEQISKSTPSGTAE